MRYIVDFRDIVTELSRYAALQPLVLDFGYQKVISEVLGAARCDDLLDLMYIDASDEIELGIDSYLDWISTYLYVKLGPIGLSWTLCEWLDEDTVILHLW